jgi:hypothetical protein
VRGGSRTRNSKTHFFAGFKNPLERSGWRVAGPVRAGNQALVVLKPAKAASTMLAPIHRRTADGTLAPDECHELVALLATMTGDRECYFRLAEIPFVGTDQNLLFAGALNEVEDFFLSGRFQFTPEYWWPRDRSWCVCTDYDLEFTVVGGRSSLIDSLLRSTILECVEVSSGVRVDDWTPIPHVGL